MPNCSGRSLQVQHAGCAFNSSISLGGPGIQAFSSKSQSRPPGRRQHRGDYLQRSDDRESQGRQTESLAGEKA
jgi:hypothetical protein